MSTTVRFFLGFALQAVVFLTPIAAGENPLHSLPLFVVWIAGIFAVRFAWRTWVDPVHHRAVPRTHGAARVETHRVPLPALRPHRGDRPVRGHPPLPLDGGYARYRGNPSG